MQAGPSNPKAVPPVKAPKRKLACAACRARRIRCEWPPHSNGCVACALAELRCPGEPEPRKRTKKGAEGGSSSAVAPTNNTQAEMERFTLGGALTFHLIESLFVMANPSVPGMDYWMIRDLLHAAGGSSKEMEIAAECLCSAFIASSATFSDHATIVGPGDAEMPTDLVSGTVASYDSLVPYGARRTKAVASLAERAVSMFEESGIKDRPGVETIYTMLALDQCSTLTTDGGRQSRDFILGAAGQLKHLLDRHAELPASQLSALRGSLGYHILSLDATTAAILRAPLAITDYELSTYFSHIDFSAIPPPTLDSTRLVNDEEGWSELGKQLAPLQLSTLNLYRTLIDAGDALPPSATIELLWNGIDTCMSHLASADVKITSLPPLDTKELTDHRQFDLFGLTNAHRRNLLRLDLLIHQRIVEAALASEEEPDPAVLRSYEVSRERVQRVFVAVTAIAKQNVFYRSLLYVRRLFEMLEVCSTWTSLRTADQETAAELIGELGITGDSAAILLQALALAAWSSPIAAQQRNGLRLGLGGALAILPPPAGAQAQAPQGGMVAAASPPEQKGGYGSPGLYPPPAVYPSQGAPYGYPATSQQPYYPSFPGALQPTPQELDMIPQAHPPQQYAAGAYSHQHQRQPSYPSFPPSNSFNSPPYGEAYSPHSASGYTPAPYGLAPSPAQGGWDGSAPRWSAPAGERWS